MLAGLLVQILFVTQARAQTLQDVNGSVQVRSTAGETAPALDGQKLSPHDTLILGAGSGCRLLMPDSNEIHLFSNTQFEIEDYGSSAMLKLIQGEIRAQVKQKYDGEKSHFNVVTPSASAGVRGTDFVVAYAENTQTSKVTTLRGNVLFGQPGPDGKILNSVPVPAGMRSVAVAGQPPRKSVKVPKSELEKLANRNVKTDKSSSVNHPHGEKRKPHQK